MANKDGDRKLYISIALKIFSEFNKRKQKTTFRVCVLGKVSKT